MSTRAILPGQPHDADGPVFREPWEAQALATTLMLHQRGLFTWSEWTAALAGQIAAAAARGACDLGATYYQHWLAALESIIARKGASSSAELHRYRHAWQRAADRTAHGLPVELQPDDFSS